MNETQNTNNATNGNNVKDRKSSWIGISQKDIKFSIRILLLIFFFILGFNFSHTAFFNVNPLFGIRFLAEIPISIASALFGFFYVPILLRKVQYWVETLIMKTVTDIVSNFWDMQSRRIQQARREKQKLKSKETEKKLREQLTNSVLLDTSVLIDGRILDIVKTGFISDTLVVPKFVIDELHLISDNDETLKRQRGRRGLDIINELKRHTKVNIPDTPTAIDGVDKQLVQFAKHYKIRLMTLDFNLNKVASVSGIQVLNVNQLVNAVKTVVLPGEILSVKIIQEGKEKEQGVGYLEDGTMIVVEGAKTLVGKEITAKVTRVIQSAAGKMIFCNLV